MIDLQYSVVSFLPRLYIEEIVNVQFAFSFVVCTKRDWFQGNINKAKLCLNIKGKHLTTDVIRSEGLILNRCLNVPFSGHPEALPCNSCIGL